MTSITASPGDPRHALGAVIPNGSYKLSHSSTSAAQGAASDAAPAVQVTLSDAARSLASSGGQKDFATVARDARDTLNAGYEKLGKVADGQTVAGDWKTAFGDMDRRSLFAVASNEGGQFSDTEQDVARYFMTRQQSEAMGLTNGLRPDPKDSYRAAITFLDGVSDEEKASFGWAKERAAAQFGYEQLARRDGEEPENVDSESPLVKMIKSAMDALAATKDPSRQLEDMPQYRQAEAYHASGGNSEPKSLVDRVA